MQVAHGGSGRTLTPEVVQDIIELTSENTHESFTPVGSMVDWFLEHYENPVHHVPHDSSEGGYQYYAGGPFDARDVLEEQFPDASVRSIDEAASYLVDESTEWVRKDDY